MQQPGEPVPGSGADLPSLSVVVPCYRTPGTLGRLVAEVEASTRGLVSGLEFVLVDDGSPDDTWSAVKEVVSTAPNVRGLQLMRNFGQHNALLAGMRAATGDLVLTMDDDLQNPPDQIPLLFAALTADVDLVYGYPLAEQQTGARNAASRLTKRALRMMMGSVVNPRHSAFRLFRSRLVRVADDVRDPHISIDVILSWATARQAAVPVRFDVRAGGRSGYSLRSLTRHAMNMITGYGIAPLRMVTYLGILAALLGFLLAAYVVLRYLFWGTPVQGFTFVAAGLNFFAGVQLLALGMVGEYIGRIYRKNQDRPLYLVDREIRTKAQG